MARNEKKLRGIFEKPPDSGIFYIQYFDINGNRRREKVGRRSTRSRSSPSGKQKSSRGKSFQRTFARALSHSKNCSMTRSKSAGRRTALKRRITTDSSSRSCASTSATGRRRASASRRLCVSCWISRTRENGLLPASTAGRLPFHLSSESESRTRKLLSTRRPKSRRRRRITGAFAFCPIPRRRSSSNTSGCTTRSTSPRFSSAFTLECERGSSFGCNGRISISNGGF